MARSEKKYHRLCMYDMDVFSYVAEILAREFDEVYYFAALSSGPYPKLQEEASGEGVSHIIRVNEEEWYDALPDADVVMFPYLYTSGLQEFLRKSGYPVWGSGAASWLELDRWRAHSLMQELGMPTPHADLVVGVDALWDAILEKSDVFLKISYWRGNAETFHHEDIHITKAWIDKLRYELGPLAASYYFVIEEPIDDAVEIGYDGACVNGTYLPIGAIGYECKNMGYLGKVLPFDEIPEPVKYGLDCIGPYLGATATNLSNEVRVTPDGTPYVVDWTLRGGSPPSECMFESFKNWGEIIYNGARGQVTVPEPACKYFAQIQVHSSWIKDKWMPISFPKSLERWVKCYSKVEVDGRFWIPPAKDSSDVCAVTAIGDTMEATIELVHKRLEQVKGLEFEKKDDVFDEIFDTINKGEQYGIDW